MSFEPNKKPWYLGCGFILSVLFWIAVLCLLFPEIVKLLERQ